MRTRQLLKRNLFHFWRTNLAVIFGVAAAVSVLAGALLVGDSVRGSLREMFLSRVGGIEYAIVSTGFFREQLAKDLDEQLPPSYLVHVKAPLIELEGTVSNETTRARARGVRVYGVDDRFWGDDQRTLTNRETMISASLAGELDSRPGDSVLVQFEKPSDVPIESLYGQKDDLGRTMRLTIKTTLTMEEGGEFSIRPQQTAVRAVFVPLRLLQETIDQPGKANVLLLTRSKDTAGISDEERTGVVTAALNRAARLEDYGLNLRTLDVQSGLSLERASTLLDDNITAKARAAVSALRAGTTPVLSYVVNGIALNSRTVPYSLVSAVDDATFTSLAGVQPTGQAQIVLNEWTARDLNAKAGDSVSLDYYVWRDDGKLETKAAQFEVAAVVPINGLAADRNLVPDYPGISDSPNMSDWDPPFPVDLSKIRPQDEQYWEQFKTTPKAFIPLSVGQNLWQSRYGNLTSLRVIPSNADIEKSSSMFRAKLQESFQPEAMGLTILHVKGEGLAASQGATNFGEYFLYFSFFIVVSALLLTSLFFKLGVEQRLREIGLLQAIGFSAKRIRQLFLIEGLVLAALGSMIGLLGAVGYAALMMHGLRTWWVDAVGTTMLRLHVSPLSLLIGGVGGVVAAVLCIVWTLRRVGRSSTRSLLTGTAIDADRAAGKRSLRSVRTLLAIITGLAGIALIVTAALRLLPQQVGFFAGGTLLLISLLCWQSSWLRGTRKQTITGHGWWSVLRLGFRNATYRPARSVLCIALIASAAFIIVSVDSFRRGQTHSAADKQSGSGGFLLMAESLVPLVHDLNSTEGRDKLSLNGPSLTGANVSKLRLRPGDDASCLNLYQPRNPRILGLPAGFIDQNRFGFQKSLAQTQAELSNPWLILNRELGDAIVPIIADANSASYVLHLGLGEDLPINTNRGTVRLRLVGTLADSIFQSELLMAEKQFVQLFPDQEGFRYFLIDVPEAQAHHTALALEDKLSDYGFDVVSTSERLATFHRVENTYLSTFQMLGGLGLLLGTLGMAAVLLRNVLERRRELALLRAFGYNSSHFATMVFAENAFLLIAGLVTGAVCASLAIAPVFIERGGRLPNISLAVLLLLVLISGLAASLLATWSALRSPLLPALSAE